MRYSTPTFIFLSFLALFSFTGCGSDGPTVIEPTETYELTEQEAKNRERAQKVLAEQRQ